jgi:hypothetical protein
LASVDEAVERKPFKKARVVEVAFSAEPRVLNGKAKGPPAVGQEVLQSLEIQRVVKAPVEEKKLVVVALVPVAFWKKKFWSVVEAKNVCSPPQMLLVVVPKPIDRAFEPLRTMG